jgi:hypothetical protein
MYVYIYKYICIYRYVYLYTYMDIGSLLFVDISGFTVLSQLLHIESLKTQINAYFTNMLDVIDRCVHVYTYAYICILTLVI